MSLTANPKKLAIAASIFCFGSGVYSQTVLINPATDGGFETGADFPANGWMVDNGSVTNQWFVGTVPTGMTNRSAYVSNDGGGTNAYTNTSISVSHFYRDVTFPAGESVINLTFTYRVGGESGFWDGIIVSLAPTSYTPTASNVSLAQGVLPAPTVELGRYWTSGSATVSTATIRIPVSVVNNCAGASTMRLIFTWKNDSGGGAGATSIDNISLTSQAPTIPSAGGTYTIDNTLPTGGTNFASFTDAINALNLSVGACNPFSGPVVFNVSAGQTFNELPPVIQATGTAAGTITFQKSGAGTNPVISSTGTAASNEGSLVVSGGDYFTFDGIDINNSAGTTMEYGYIIRNGSATNGAQNNTIRNATIRLNRNVSASTSSAILVSASSTGSGVTATAASGSNSNTTIQNITIDGAVNGINMIGTSGFADAGTVINTTAGIRNVIMNIGPTTSTFVTAAGIIASNQSGFTINNCDISAVASNQGTARGIFVSGNVGNSFVTNNKITGISNSGSTSTTSVAYGIQAQNSTTGTNNVRIANNMISNIFTSFTGAATASRYAIGIHVGVASAGATQSYDVYHNSVSMGEGLTPTYSNSCFEIQNVAAVYRVQNNIFANFTNAQAGAARHYTWVTTSATNLGAAGSISDRNDLYIANGAGASGFTARANTNDLNTLANWVAAITAIPGTDANSTAINPAFVNNTTDLHLALAVPSQVESGGASLGIATDIDGQVRPGPAGSVNGGATAPDMGADEFDGFPAPPPVITLNSVTPPAAMQCTAAARLVSANVTTASGSLISVVLAYAVNGTPQAPITMTNTGGSTYEATIPVPTPANATIAWSIAAANTLGSSASYVGTSYADQPLLPYTSAATASASVICAGSPVDLTGLMNNPAASTLYTTPSITYPTTDEDLRTVSITQGATTLLNNTSTVNTLNGTIGTPTGTAGSYSNYTALTPTTLNGSQTYTLFVASIDAAASFYANYATAFIDYNGDGDFADAGESLIPPTGLLLNAATDNGNDSISVSFTVPATAINGLTRMRVSITETGQTNAAGSLNSNYGEFEDYAIMIAGATPGTTANVTSVSWMDGATPVGTGNPLTVNPTTTTTYTANITAFGCTFTPAPTVTVTVNPLPAAVTATNSTQCGLQVPTASVASNSGVPTPTFNWYSAPAAGTLLQTGTSSTYTTAISSTTTFYVSEVDGGTGCESPRVAVTVTVATPDAVSASASVPTLCLDGSITLTAANTNPAPVQNYTYSWSSVAGSGADSPVAGSPASIMPTAAGTYTYTLTAVDGGCTATSTVSVTVNPKPSSIVAASNDTEICIGEAVNLSVTSTTGSPTGISTVLAQDFNAGFGSWTTTYSGSAPIATQWLVQNAPYTIDGTMDFTNFATPNGGGFAMTNGDLGSSGNKTRAVMTSPTFSTVGLANATLTFQNLYQRWASGDSLVAVQISTDGGATWAILKEYFTLGVNQGVVTNNAQVPANESITLGAAYLNQPNLRIRYNYVSTWGYYWLVDDIRVSGNIVDPTTYAWTSTPAGFTSSTQNPTGIAPSVTTDYTVNITNSFGCSASGSVNVIVNALPVVDAGAPQTVCSGTSVTLAGAGAASYTWDNGVTDNVAFNATATTTYTVTGTDGNGCENTDNVTVTVNALPSVVANATDPVLCTGESVTLTGSGATSYTWDNSVNDGVAFTPSATATYTVTGTDGNGCENTDQITVSVNALPSVDAGAPQTVCSGTSVTLAGSGAASYDWDNGVTDNTPFTATATTTYTVTGTDVNGCENTDMVTVTVNALPSVDAGAPQTVCEGEDVTLAGSGATSYDWDNGVTDNTPFTATATTTYTVTGTDGNGCENTDMVTVTVNALPSVDAGADMEVCDGSSVTLSGSGATSYDWDNSVTDGVSFVPTATTTYTVTGTDANGCENTDDVTVTVNALPSVDAGADMEVCDGSSVTLSGSGATSYDWDNSVTDGVSFVPAATTTYTVTGTDANGCENTDDVTVTVNALPSVDAGADQTVCAGEMVTLSGSGADTYDWNNGVTDGVAFEATATTTYTVTGTDANGCENTDMAIVTVNSTVATATDNGDSTITASAGTSYQWVHCATGLPIAGATSQTYTATVNGDYAVVVTNANGCSDTSNCVTITGLGMDDLTDASIKVFPNPTNGDVYVTMTAAAATIEVVDAQGKLLQKVTVQSGEKVELSAYETGVYFLRIATENGSAVERIVKN